MGFLAESFMKQWEKEIKKRTYDEGNGNVLDSLDALQVARIAEKEGINLIVKQSLDIIKEYRTEGVYKNVMIISVEELETIIQRIKSLKK